MEKPHLNHIDERVDLGIVGLKHAEMPQPPSSLVERMVAGEAPRRHRPRSRIWVLGACSLLAVGTFALLPRSSSAAVALDKVVKAHQSSSVLFKVTPYWINRGQRTPKIWSGYVMGNKWRYVQKDYEQACDGSRILTYIPAENRAESWTIESGEAQLGAVLGDADLSWWKGQSGKGLKFEHNVEWNGRRVDRYVVITSSKDWGETINTLYADPVAQRPLYAESVHSSGSGNAMRWEYLDAANDGVLVIQLKQGTKVVDVTDQRRRRADAPGTPVKASIGCEARSTTGF